MKNEVWTEATKKQKSKTYFVIFLEREKILCYQNCILSYFPFLQFCQYFQKTAGDWGRPESLCYGMTNTESLSGTIQSGTTQFGKTTSYRTSTGWTSPQGPSSGGRSALREEPLGSEQAAGQCPSTGRPSPGRPCPVTHREYSPGKTSKEWTNHNVRLRDDLVLWGPSSGGPTPRKQEESFKGINVTFLEFFQTRSLIFLNSVLSESELFI